jgi:low affinity Fe/Cu permease
MDLGKAFARFSSAVAKATGSPPAFVICIATVAAWAISGPLFGFSDTWQLVINTGTTIVTFLMVFLIQNTQNRDTAAVQAKLDDLILTSKADDEFIGVERLSDKELDVLRLRCAAKAKASHAMLERVHRLSESRKARTAGTPAQSKAASKGPTGKGGGAKSGSSQRRRASTEKSRGSDQ